MTEVAAGIHRLTNGVSNFYMIEESGNLVLVGAGAPRDWDQDAIRRARAAGRS
jgi:hypothetical protein